jgi:cbb3-type cytochrome oxidase subunit 1
MHSLNNWALRFVRWGMGLTILGLVIGYVPLGHYLLKDALPSCPTAPIHGHVILLSFVGMPLFGLLYLALPTWMENTGPPLGLVRLHFWLAVVGTIGVSINGTLGYELLTHSVVPDFYYAGPQAQAVRNLWFAIDGAFLTLYGAGCVILFYVVMKKTAYSATARASELALTVPQADGAR